MDFTIKQGFHYPNKWFHKFIYRECITDRLAYSVALSENAWYPERYVAYSGWNKIFGFGAHLHHYNSARFVWQPAEEGGKLTIAAYVYELGVWTAIPFSHMYVNAAKSLGIEATDDKYIFHCGNDKIEVAHCNPQHDKKLWPYFGGWDRAYGDIIVSLIPIDDIKWVTEPNTREPIIR